MEPELWRIIEGKLLGKLRHILFGNVDVLETWMLLRHIKQAVIMDVETALQGRLWPNGQN